MLDADARDTDAGDVNAANMNAGDMADTGHARLPGPDWPPTMADRDWLPAVPGDDLDERRGLLRELILRALL